MVNGIKRVTVISAGRSATKTVCASIAEVLAPKSRLWYEFRKDIRGDTRHLGEILNFQLESQVGHDAKTFEPRRNRETEADAQLVHLWMEATENGFKYVAGHRATNLDTRVIHNRLCELEDLDSWVIKVFPTSWSFTPFDIDYDSYRGYISRLVSISDLTFILRRRDDVARARSMSLLRSGYSGAARNAQFVERAATKLDVQIVDEDNKVFDRITQEFGIRQVYSEDLINDVNGSVAASLGLPPLNIVYKREYPTNKEEL